MTIRTATVALLAELNALAALCNNGFIQYFTGAQPATPQTAVSGTLLGTCGFGATAFGAAAVNGNNGQITANAISDDSDADATGAAGWFRVFESDGVTAVFDGSVSAVGGGGDAIINTTAIQIHGRIRTLSLTYTLPM